MLRALGLTTAAIGLLSFVSIAQADPLAPTGKWSAYQGGSATTPPMGWSSWNSFATDITEAKIMGVADALVKTGLAASGYRYVNMDDGWWQKRRQPDGRIQIRIAQFPSAAVGSAEETSFKPLTEKLHAMGLKAGIYSDMGRNSCSQAYSPGVPNLAEGSVAEREIGLYGHVDQDIALYMKDWGFDYIKVDGCGLRAFTADNPIVKSGQFRELTPLIDGWNINTTDVTAVRNLYTEVGTALARYKPNGDFIFSLCAWGSADVRSWAKDVGSISRTSDDLSPHWVRMLYNFDTAVTRPLYAHPKSWNDPDMLYVGAGDFDGDHLTEARSHFALWAIINAPLILGNDVRTMPKALLDIVSNPAIIAINQDPAGNQAVLAYDAQDIQILVKTLASGKKAVAVFNRGLAAVDADLTAQHLKYAADKDIVLTDLWTKKKITFKKETKLALAPRQTLIFEAEGTRQLQNGLYLSEMPGSVNPAVDGVQIPQPDPTLFRSQPWGGTHGNGAHPQYAGWGGAQADYTPFGQSLRVAGESFDSGIGVLANSRLEVRNNGAKTFTTEVGIDDSSPDKTHPVSFAVYGDGKLLAQSKPTRFREKAETLAVNVKGVKIIELVARNDATPIMQPTVVTWGNAALTK